MPSYAGQIRIGAGIQRALSVIRGGFARMASAWAQVQSAEEQRFQESIGRTEEDEDTENEPVACSTRETAPNLADIVRKRQETQPRDLMYEHDERRPKED